MQQINLDTLAENPNRVGTRIDDTSYYVEANIPLTPSMESALSAAFFPAFVNGLEVISALPVDAQFIENNQEIIRVATQWWKWVPRNPFIIKTVASSRPPQPKGALFFTGGVDSFCSLLRHPSEIVGLIHVHGFDIPLDDTERYQTARAWIEAVGKETGIMPIYVSTNLRQNRFFGDVNWEISHGAALSCIAHLLSSHFGSVFLASSDVPPPWGSNEALDPFWSSSIVKIINDGWELSRLEKVKFISRSKLVHKYLKVCWENNSKNMNCGFCEKCVRTQAQFAVVGALECLETFPPGNLSSKIDGIPNVHGELKKQWLDIRRETGNTSVQRSIDRLLARSKKITLRKIVRKLKKHLKFPLPL